MKACQFEHPSIVERLLQAGAQDQGLAEIRQEQEQHKQQQEEEEAQAQAQGTTLGPGRLKQTQSVKKNHTINNSFTPR